MTEDSINKGYKGWIYRGSEYVREGIWTKQAFGKFNV